MLDLPERNPAYHRGPSTPRPFRVNDRLWHDFMDIAHSRGFSGSEALKRLIEGFILINKKKPKRRTKPPQDESPITISFEE